MKGIKLEGKRISLGPVKISDASIINSYVNDKETSSFLGRSGINSIKDTKQYIRSENEKENVYYWGVRLNDSGLLIGSMSLRISDEGIAGTGAMLGRDFTEKGYGTEAKHLVLEYAFNTLGLVKIFSGAFSYNPRSKAYSLKCGYIHEATITNKKFYNGKYWDEWILSITKEQWEKSYKKYAKKHGL